MAARGTRPTRFPAGRVSSGDGGPGRRCSGALRAVADPTALFGGPGAGVRAGAQAAPGGPVGPRGESGLLALRLRRPGLCWPARAVLAGAASRSWDPLFLSEPQVEGLVRAEPGRAGHSKEALETDAFRTRASRRDRSPVVH